MSRSPRRSREETRELVLGAALELVRSRGLGVEPMTLTYQQVFDHLEATRGVRVTRASVHERLWASQEEFQLDVILRVSSMDTGLDAAVEVAAESIARTANAHPLDRLRDLGRTAPNAVLRIASQDPLFYSWVGYTLSIAKDASTPATKRARLAEQASREYADAEKRGADLVRLLSGAIGVRPIRSLFNSDDEGFQTIARLGLTLAEGAIVRMRFEEDELPNIVLKTGPDGEEQTWTAFAAGYWALLNTFLEVDPDADTTTTDP